MFVAELCPLSLPPPVHPEGNPEGAANTKCVKVGSRASEGIEWRLGRSCPFRKWGKFSGRSALLMRDTMVLRKRKAVLRDDDRDDVDDGRDGGDVTKNGKRDRDRPQNRLDGQNASDLLVLISRPSSASHLSSSVYGLL